MPRGLGADPTAIALGIQQQEGFYPGSRAYTNNNPGNLMYAGQPGAIGVDPQGFAIFPDYATGFQALVNQVNLDASRGLTISQFTAKYAPAGIPGNDPAVYAKNLAAALGLSPTDLLTAPGAASDASIFGGVGAGIPWWGWAAAGVLGLLLVREIFD